jgi:hypothetical protein
MFTVTAAGLPTLRYQWRRNGTPIAGATASKITFNPVQLSDGGGYSVFITNDFGSTLSAEAVLTVIPLIPLEEALDATNLTWSTQGHSPWYPQVAVTHDQVDAGVSGAIGHNQQSRLSTIVPGPGRLTFWWKVSSQASADLLTFAISGSRRAEISGEVGWQQQTLDVSPGWQTLEWIYQKDASGVAGQDRAWLDTVAFTATPMSPVILTQPQGVAVMQGSPVRFSVTAQGTPDLSFQWRLDGADIAGATSTELNIAAAQHADGGAYQVLVTNPHGSVLSSNAVLGLIYLGMVGENSFGQSIPPSSAAGLVAIAAGAWHSLALRADGSLVAWGNNWDGQCTMPAGLNDAVAIAAGGYHNLAVRANGAVAAWGANYYGQTAVPASLRSVLAVAAGTWHSLALTEDGRVVAWGDNNAGQCAVPPGLSDVVAIAAGGNHSLALRRNGAVVAWGENTDAQGIWAGQSAVPPGLNNVVAIAAGEYHSLAVKANGTVVAWGDNAQGQSQIPANLADVVSVSAGAQHSLALRRDGTLRAWGNNWSGQCSVPSGAPAEAIAAGGYHTQILFDSGLRAARLFRIGQRGTGFGVVLQTQVRATYALEFTDDFTGDAWTSLPEARGSGGLLLLTDPNPAGSRRFYRVRQF